MTLICPITKTDCVRSDCAWWLIPEETGISVEACAIWAIASSLFEIEEDLVRLNKEILELRNA